MKSKLIPMLLTITLSAIFAGVSIGALYLTYELGLQSKIVDLAFYSSIVCVPLMVYALSLAMRLKREVIIILMDDTSYLVNRRGKFVGRNLAIEEKPFVFGSFDEAVSGDTLYDAVDELNLIVVKHF